jgi:hypothetical protein
MISVMLIWPAKDDESLVITVIGAVDENVERTIRDPVTTIISVAGTGWTGFAAGAASAGVGSAAGAEAGV